MLSQTPDLHMATADSSGAPRFSAGTVTVAVDGALLQGTVHAADTSLGLLLLELSEVPVSVPAEGSVVRLGEAGQPGFGAQAELIEVEDDQRWVLGVPSDLSPAQQRRSTRLLADGAWRFVSEDADGEDNAVELYDLSKEGVGLQYPAGSGPDGAGRRMEGVLVCDQAGAWPVSLESTNVRRHPEDGRLWIVGCTLQHRSADGAAGYAAILADLA